VSSLTAIQLLKEFNPVEESKDPELLGKVHEDSRPVCMCQNNYNKNIYLLYTCYYVMFTVMEPSNLIQITVTIISVQIYHTKYYYASPITLFASLVNW